MRTLYRQEAVERARLLDVASYDIDLDLSGDDSGFDSTTVIRFTCREPGATTFVELDASPVRVVLNGVELPAVTKGARIALPDLQADNELLVVARCAYSRTGEGLHRFVDPADGLVYVWGQSATADAQRMYACFDQPDLKATFRLRVAAPPDWTVIATGRGTRDDEGHWSFAPTARMSTYLFSLSGGPWHGVRRWHDGIELGVWCRQSLASNLEEQELFEITAQCLDGFHEAFGIRYPFGDTYDQLWVPELNFGAMENPGAVTFSESLLFRSRVTDAERRGRSVVIAHEMAHMWFGNLVTMTWWEDLWLNESFADLMGYLLTDRVTRFDGVWPAFCVVRKVGGYAADQLPTTHPIAGTVPDSASALLNVDGITYAKGASALRQLMAWLGEETFFAGLRRYLERHAFGNTTLADFLSALQEASGRDLDAWAQSWLRTSGVSTLRVQEGAIQQVPSVAYPVLRDHRLGIGCYDRTHDGLVLTARHEVDVTGDQTPVDGPLHADLVLVNDGDLTFAKVRFDPRSLETVLASLRELPDPLSRAVCWGALHDAARDAELSPGAFVDAVIAHAEVETDSAVLTQLLRQAQLAATSWSPDVTVRERLATWLGEVAATAEPGSDRQLTATLARVTAVADDAALRALLDQPPAGLAMDTELRWHLLRRRAQLGGVGVADIEAELTRDTTAAGQRHAAYARAARPDLAAKTQAWELAMRDTSLSGHLIQSCADGFWQHESAELCRPWVERYFAEIAGQWGQRSPEVGRAVAALLYPSVLVEQEVLDRTDAFLDGDGLPSGLRRVVREEQDGLRRAVAARALERSTSYDVDEAAAR